MTKLDELVTLLRDEPVEEHAAVLAYESGNVLENAMYLKWSLIHDGIASADALVMRGKLKSELMDVMAQAWSLCIKLGEEPSEWLEMGCEKAVEAIRNKLSGRLHEHVDGKW